MKKETRNIDNSYNNSRTVKTPQLPFISECPKMDFYEYIFVEAQKTSKYHKKKKGNNKEAAQNANRSMEKKSTMRSCKKWRGETNQSNKLESFQWTEIAYL